VSDLPGGTVTLVFTDIEGSTRLLASLGSRYEAVLADHRKLLRSHPTAGVEVDTPSSEIPQRSRMATALSSNSFASSGSPSAAVTAAKATAPSPSLHLVPRFRDSSRTVDRGRQEAGPARPLH
jgi:hypothetical protein